MKQRQPRKQTAHSTSTSSGFYPLSFLAARHITNSQLRYYNVCARQARVTLPTYWWSFPVYSSSKKNWFHIHPRFERWRTLPPSASGIPNTLPIFPGLRGMAVLGHNMDSAKRSSSWLAIIVSNQLQNVPNDLQIMVIGFWLDEHWKAVSSEQTLYSSAWDVVQIPAGEDKAYTFRTTSTKQSITFICNLDKRCLMVIRDILNYLCISFFVSCWN